MKHKVVIAEDFRMIRETFESAVKGMDDYEIEASFSTAFEAVEYLKEYDAELVIMDVLFPGSMNGLEAAEKIKEIKPHIRIIVVTSMPELTYEKRAKEIGVNSFWQKEVQEQPLREIIERTMQGESIYPSKHMRHVRDD